MGVGQSKNDEHNSMEDIKSRWKTRADILKRKSLQECVTRIEQLEEGKSDKFIYIYIYNYLLHNFAMLH